ncbi:MAG: hypothetical protein ACR2Q4_20030 [Geminicoccaceae bacterium]
MYGDVLNIEKVFGLHRGDTQHYVERDGVDLNFVEAISREKHVAIFGCSKQGKTTLRKKHLDESQYLLVTCDPSWTVEDLHAAILNEAGCVVSTGRETHAQKGAGGNAELGATIKVPFFEYRGKVGTNGRTATTTVETFDELPIDMADPKQIAGILEKTTDKTIIVIEEFHYLPEKTQRQFAFKMKTFHEISDYVFIVIGVWLEENRLVVLNSDLGGRVTSVNADVWSRDDLTKVIVDGGKLMNVTFHEEFVSQLVNEAAGSVYIAREACYRALEDFGIYNAQRENVLYDQKVSIKTLVRNIGESLSDYQTFALNLGRMPKNAKGFARWIIYLLISSGPQDMRGGISLRKLRIRLCKQDPSFAIFKETHIRDFLLTLASLQRDANLPVILDYDRRQQKVRVTDKGFILWRKAQKKEDMMEMVFDAHDAA